jgi:DNA-binding transcriptional ArsR family regulator/GTPase SAR1 family protein
VGVVQNFKRSLVAFSLEFTCIVFTYLTYLLWSGILITGSILTDVLFFSFLIVLFMLNYAVTSRYPSDEGESVEATAPSGGTKKEQVLKYLKVLDRLNSGQLASLLEIDIRNLSKFVNPLIQAGIVTARKEGKTFIYGLKDAHTFLHTHNRHNSSGEADYGSHAALPRWDVKLPAEGNMLGRIALDDWKLGEFLYLPLKKHAQKGILVSGASGSGKTVAAKVIAEELLDDDIPVLVFDSTKQWERLKDKNTDDEMLKRYRLFGMRQNSKGYKLQTIREMISTDEILDYRGATIFDLSGISEEADRVERVALALDSILEYFELQKDSNEVRLLVVVEEAHLWTLKEVGKDAIRFLDKAVRMLRKKGVGVMLVSHKISDFDPAMRSAMNISIFFRTKYSGDLDTISKVLGSEFSKIAPNLPVGYSIFHLADIGDPCVLAWRSTYSQP